MSGRVALENKFSWFASFRSKMSKKKKDKAIFVVVLVKANVDQPGVM